MDERLSKAIHLINEVASDQTMFMKLLELGKMLEFSEARDLLEQVSNALSDEIFYGIAHHAQCLEDDEKVHPDMESEACMIDLTNWDEEAVYALLPYYLALGQTIPIRQRKRGCENEYVDREISFEKLVTIYKKKIPDLIYVSPATQGE